MLYFVVYVCLSISVFHSFVVCFVVLISQSRLFVCCVVIAFWVQGDLN